MTGGKGGAGDSGADNISASTANISTKKGRSKPTDGMTATERKAVFSLASIYALRMAGLFMILPVFALYAQDLEGVTPTLIGVAIGIYGLTQAAFQIPMGLLSDRWGRKPVIIMGLVIFAIGSGVAASADTITGVVLGRALQGAGAIAAAIMALTADLTQEENRTGAMAVIGMSIGMAFMFSLVVGPILDNWIGVPGIFWLTAVLAFVAIIVVKWIVPNPVRSGFHRDAMAAPEQLKEVIRDQQLLRLDFGVFALHFILTATFVVLPLVMVDAGLASADHWIVYLPVMFLSMAMMVPFIILAEKRRRMKEVFSAAIITLAIAEVVMLLVNDALAGIVFALFMFFVAFNVLEASLPSLIAKTVMPHNKGTAMGVFSTSQFLGAFFGGFGGGAVYELFGYAGVFGVATAMAIVWFFMASTMKSPRYLSSYLIRVGEVDETQAKKLVADLTKVTGVAEAVVIPDDNVAYLKVDLHALDKEALQQYSVA